MCSLAAIVAYTILSHGSHVHDAEIARIEAEAFISNVQQHVSLELLMGVAWSESRFSQTGSAADLRSHHYGVFQIFCDDNGSIPCESYLDPATNIRRGASLLALRWQQVHSRRQRQRVLANWVAAYYWGSVPATRRRGVVRRFYAYAARVHAAQRMMHARMMRARAEAHCITPVQVQ